MSMTRRDLLGQSVRYLLLTSAAATAWEYLKAGNAEAVAELQDDRPLVVDAARRPRLHRLRQLRPRLRPGERRPGGLLPHLGRALSRRRLADRAPAGRFAQRRQGRIRRRPAGGRQELLRAQALQSLHGLALRAGMSRGRDLRCSRRRGAGGLEVLPRLPLLRAGLPVRLPLHPPGETDGREVHALLSPDHQGI